MRAEHLGALGYTTQHAQQAAPHGSLALQSAADRAAHGGHPALEQKVFYKQAHGLALIDSKPEVGMRFAKHSMALQVIKKLNEPGAGFCES